MIEGDATIFDKIIAKQIPANIVYEDEKVLAFKDIAPQAPFHAVLIPKNRDGLTRLIRVALAHQAEEKNQEILGYLLVTAAKIARDNNLEPGYRLVVNDGEHGGSRRSPQARRSSTCTSTSSEARSAPGRQAPRNNLLSSYPLNE